MSNVCLPANPDVSGVGVRAAIYAQNFLSFVPAFYALSDGKVTVDELDSIEIQSSTILITALAILVSAIVEGLTNKLSNIHAAIILNLSWMNNTNLLIYFLLYLHHTATNSRSGTTALRWRFWWNVMWELFGRVHDVPMDEGNQNSNGETGWKEWLNRVTRRRESSHTNNKERKSPGTFVLFLGVIHLTLMACVGLWLWIDPLNFGSSRRRRCHVPPSLIVLGYTIPLTSEVLRDFSIVMYSVVLTPLLNILIPMALVILFYIRFNRRYRESPPTNRSFVKVVSLLSLQSPFKGGELKNYEIFPISVCLLLLATINVLFVVDTEVTLHRNKQFQEAGESDWSFGQTLAILLLLIPLRDVLESFIKRRGNKVQVRIGKAHEATPQLHRAIEMGSLPMIQKLVGDGAQVDLQDKDGISPFQRAISSGSHDIVKFLGDEGAQLDLNLKDKDGKYPLCKAAHGGYIDIVKYLIDKGAQLESRDKDGHTPIQIAASQGHSEVVRYLGDKGAQCDLQDKNGRTPLHEAVYWNYSDIVAYLVDKGAELDVPDKDGRTPVHEAAYWGYYDTVKYLRDKGAKLELQDKNGETPLLIAASRGHSDVMRCLLQRIA